MKEGAKGRGLEGFGVCTADGRYGVRHELPLLRCAQGFTARVAQSGGGPSWHWPGRSTGSTGSNGSISRLQLPDALLAPTAVAAAAAAAAALCTRRVAWALAQRQARLAGEVSHIPAVVPLVVILRVVVLGAEPP